MSRPDRHLDATICLVPRTVRETSVALLEARFQDVPGVRVVCDDRRGERRGSVRRRGGGGPPAAGERRGVRNPNGRRVDERRRALTRRPPLSLPPAVEGADRIQFVAPCPKDSKRLAIAESLRLVVRFQLGEPDVFREIYERHFDGVYGYLLTALRDPHDAEDGAQEVFIRALRGLAGYEFRGSPFEAWLFRIVRNHTLNVKQRAAPVSPADPSSIELWRDRRTPSQLAPTGSDQDLIRYVARLPPSQRQVIVLRYMVGLEWADIATVLQRSSGAVRQLEQRALTYLRKRLEATAAAPAARTRSLPMRRHASPSPVAAGRRRALSSGAYAA